MGDSEPVTGPLGTFAVPVDLPGVAAVVIGLLLFAAMRDARLRRHFADVDHRWVVAGLGATAGLLSMAYVIHYLRGGPRIIDATSYFLQARALAEGLFAFEVPVPSGSFRGRFLVQHPETGALSVIFPPGYPAVLALGFLAGSPTMIGPVIAVGCVVTTYMLARRLFDRRDVGFLAASLSVVSATLRYHTADTMSHGWAALLLTGVALAASPRPNAMRAASCGVLLGWLLATRPVTGCIGAAIALGLAGIRQAPWVALGTLPGITMMLAHQYQATGHVFGSTQLAYYAIADGPPGCFRYGFGPGIGCLVEHGDFVRHNLPDGYGALSAFGTTLRRLKMHLLDVGNFEPWALVMLFGAVRGRRIPAVRFLVIPLVGVVVGYAPFYFDGNYPGGGARLFADVLPFEHVLLAWTACELGMARWVVPVALVSFGFHASHEHVRLRDREGGRPMFESAVLREANVNEGLVFVQTDHGFSLGFDPASRGWGTPLIARHRGEDHDFLLWDSLGRPPAFVYRFSPSRGGLPRVEPLSPAPSGVTEGEAEWPPVSVQGGFVRIEHAACASSGRALGFVPAPDPRKTLETTIEVAVPYDDTYMVSTAWLSSRTTWTATVELSHLRWTVRPGRPDCFADDGHSMLLSRGSHRLFVSVSGEGAALDAVRLAPTAAGGEGRHLRKGVDI
jgi:hypothetical protein